MIDEPSTSTRVASHDRIRAPRGTGVGLLVLQAVVAPTALMGGAALVVGAVIPELATVLSTSRGARSRAISSRGSSSDSSWAACMPSLSPWA
jgi:hypothetical protein